MNAEQSRELTIRNYHNTNKVTWYNVLDAIKVAINNGKFSTIINNDIDTDIILWLNQNGYNITQNHNDVQGIYSTEISWK